jgi:hypothetical protein
MRTLATNEAQNKATACRQRNGHQESELRISKRPQFRVSDIMAHALALYNRETTHTLSQTMTMALRQFMPTKYVAQAEQLLRNGNGRTPSLQTEFRNSDPKRKFRSKQDLNRQQITEE